MKFTGRKSAFSLIEIALAMGIASFALTAMMGLLSVSLGSSKASTDDTVLAAMANDLVGDLRRQSFDKASSYILGPTPPVAFFDVAGRRLKDETTNTDMERSAAIAAGAIYACTQTASSDKPTEGEGGSANMLRARLTFAWPATAIAPSNSRVVHASIARY